MRQVDIELAAQELYEAHHVGGIAWVGRSRAVKDAYREAAAKLLPCKPPAPRPTPYADGGDQ